MESLVEKYENIVRSLSYDIPKQLWKDRHFWEEGPEKTIQSEYEKQGLIAPVQVVYDYPNELLVLVWENELFYSRVNGPFRSWFIISEKSLLCNSGITSPFYGFPNSSYMPISDEEFYNAVTSIPEKKNPLSTSHKKKLEKPDGQGN